jgi:RNA polymerase sigma factor (sigma-70 family)
MQIQPADEPSLLRDFARSRDESAFRALVDRYINIVYASARRQTGDAHQAEDVTQAVFLLLAHKAHSISPDRPLSAWLLKTTSYCAANVRRTHNRRIAHETRAMAMAQTTSNSCPGGESDWRSVAPLLDEGLSRLRPKDRDVLLWRFFESRSVVQIAQALGISEHAASKRVTRAVDRLRDFFARRGVTVTSALLGTILVTNVSEAAPATLIGAVSSAATAGAGTSAAAIANAALVMTATTKLKLAVAAMVAALLMIGGGAAVVTVLAAPEPAPATNAAAAAPAASEGPASTAPSPDRVRFSDGTVARVIAIAEGHDRPTRWWAVDGSPVADPKFNGRGSVTLGGQQGRDLQILLDVTGQRMQDKSVSVAVPQSSGVGVLSVNSPQGTQLQVAINMPGGDTAVDLKVGVASGEWNQIVLWQDGAPTDLDPDNPAPKLLEIREEDGETVLDFARGFASPSENRQIIVVAAGQTQRTSAMSSDGTRETHRFRCPMNQVTKVIFQSRQFEWQEIKNVSLVAK